MTGASLAVCPKNSIPVIAARLILMKMKSPLLTLISVVALVFGFSTLSEARPKWGKPVGKPSYHGIHHGYHHGYHHSPSCGGYHGGYTRPHYGPPRLIHTREISRRYIYRKGLNRFGRPATFRVPVVTYLETYSNGTTRTYTRTH